jgi:pimeloyl-ACP methyl ester carboxylesterase
MEIPTVILGGYSHGSLVLQHLPPVPSILQPFAAPVPGSAVHEIVLRARKLSGQINLEWIKIATSDHERRQTRQANKNKLSVTMGGEETGPEQRRSSREIRRSTEGGRRSADLRHAIRTFSRKSEKHETPTTTTTTTTPKENTATNPTIQIPKVRYLLISPLTGPISFLAAPGLGLRLWHKAPECQDTVAKHNTLVLYGDQDIFSSARKFGAWVHKMEAEPGSQVSHVEVAGAGHFWVEHGVEEEMRQALREWEAGS